MNLFRIDIKKVREFPSVMMVETSETGAIIRRDEASSIIVRQWTEMESMILITKIRFSGLSNRFIKLNIVALLHESKSPLQEADSKNDPSVL